MKVPTKKVKEEVVTGSVPVDSGAVIRIIAVDDDGSVRLSFCDSVDDYGCWIWAKDARQLAQFFNNLARVLEGEEQE